MSAKAQDIGKDLGVRYLLEGSVRKAGNRVRITAQLIDTLVPGFSLSNIHRFAGMRDRLFDDLRTAGMPD